MEFVRKKSNDTTAALLLVVTKKNKQSSADAGDSLPFPSPRHIRRVKQADGRIQPESKNIDGIINFRKPLKPRTYNIINDKERIK